MKKIFNLFNSIIIASVLFISGLCLFNFNNSNNIQTASAIDDLPVYFSALKYTTDQDGELDKEIGEQVLQNSTVLVNEGEIFRITLGDPLFNQNYAIYPNPATITVDNLTVESKDSYIKNNEVVLSPESKYYDIQLNLYGANADIEGRYSITFTYLEYSGNQFADSTYKTFTFNFFLFKSTTYRASNYPAVTVSNVETVIAGSSAMYARTHQFHYSNTAVGSRRLNLPTLTYNCNRFELEITKTVYNISSTTYISLDQDGQLVQTGDIVKIFQDKTLNQAVVTFNDIGNYQIVYKYVHYSDGVKYSLDDIANQTKYDRLNMFGLQLFHSDINSIESNAVKEFKSFDESNNLIAGQQTDITFTGFSDDYVVDYNYADSLYKINNIPNNTDISFSDFSNLPTTNQSPVTFEQNCAIVKAESCYYTFFEANNGDTIWKRTSNFDGSAFTEEGVYLVKVVYTSSNAFNQAQKYTQWFYFQIKDITVSYSVQDINGQDIASNGWVNTNVEVRLNNAYNPFNSQIKLFVSSKNFNQTEYTNEVEVGNDFVTFTENKNYKVTVKFDKNLKKQITSYFSIDTTPISGVTARNVQPYGSSYIKLNAVDFFTNQKMCIEWNEKQDSNNTISAFYKYIPMASVQNTWTTAQLEAYYSQGKNIPVKYEMEYDPGKALTSIQAHNSLYNTYVTSSNIFEESGMYIFYIYDKAGNYTYQSYVIDKSNPTILQKISNVGIYITNYSAVNVLAENTTVQWGKYKVIKFPNIVAKNYNTTTWEANNNAYILDPWLKEILAKNATHTQMTTEDSCNFKTITINSQDNLYLASEIKTADIQIQINDNLFNVNNSEFRGGSLIDQYSYQIEVVKNEVLYEDIYSFYVSDESQTTDKFSSIHTLQISTDISKTIVKYKNEDVYENLSKHSYEKVLSAESIKTMHYYPINWDILNLQYITTPTLNSIELDNISVYYYQYISDYVIYVPKNGTSTLVSIEPNQYYTMDEYLTYIGHDIGNFIKNNTYTLSTLLENNVLSYSDFVKGTSLVLSKTPEIIDVYNYDESINLGQFDGEYYNYDINTIYDSANGKYNTKEGKYLIERTYKNLENTAELVGSKNDFMTRNTVFFVDRKGIVSSPVSLNLTLDPNQTDKNVLISQIGGSSYIEVLSGTDKSKTFNQIYRANNQVESGSLNYLLETNMLPVKLYFPLHKFGQTINNIFTSSNSLLFFDDNIESYISSNEMVISIENSNTNQVISNNYSYTLSSTLPQNTTSYIKIGDYYMIWSGVINNMIELPTFSSVGVWKVTISQNNKFLKGILQDLTFYINIKIEAPEFSILDKNGNQLGFDNTYYWTNNDIIRVQWTDSSNEYLAKIDKNDIKCLANGTQLNIANIVSSSNGLIHYFDIDVSSLQHNSQIEITMHYEGDPSYYTAGSWQITKIVKIDKIAPTLSIENLITNINEFSLINTVSVREGHNQPVGFNKTLSSGMFKDFAFAVDKTQFANLIFNSNDSNSKYYRIVNSKYVDSTVTELDPTDINAINQIIYSGSFNAINRAEDITGNAINSNCYYEIAEIDLAGNITIYTIYLTDISNSEPQEIVNYSDSISTYDININELTETNFNALVTAKSKFVLNSFNIYGYPWAIVTLGTQKYVFSPSKELANNQVYKYSPVTPEIVNLKDEINFGVSNANYLLTFSNLPCSNINLSIAVATQELSFIYPTLQNASFTITPQVATSTVFVDWQYIEVWEYINTKLSKSALFEKGNNEPIEFLNSDSFYLAGYTMQETNTIFAVNKPIIGAQYRYKVVDNFGTVYTFQHLYGEEFVEKIKNYDGLDDIITIDYNDNQTNISNNKFAYSYYHGITSVNIQVIEFDIFNNSYKFNQTFNNEQFGNYTEYFNVTKKGAYTTVELLPVQPSISQNGFYGGIRYYIVKSSTQIDAQITDIEYNYFMIYNLSPEINLKGKNRQDMNGLFNQGNNITSDPVTIEFAELENVLYPSIVELVYPDGARETISSGTIVSEVGDYQIIASWPNELSVYQSKTYSFTISSNAWQFYVVEVLDGDVYKEISPIDTYYTCSDQITMYNTHYLINTPNYKIRTNQTQDIQSPKYITTDIKNGIETLIYEISNYESTQPFITYFKTTIAITIVPNTNKLISDFYYLDTTGNHVNLDYSQANYTITKEYENSNSLIVSWNSTYKINENKIVAEIRFGENNELVNLKNISTTDYLYSVKLTRSGIYTFTFKDTAGNIHKFDYNTQIVNSTTSYEFTYLNNVIFTVNDQSPIQYAIYNDNVEIKIPNYTLGYYDSNAQPKIVVYRNGVEYTDFDLSTSERKWTFSETGLYEISWIAKKNSNEIRQEKYYFQIIRANELIWAYSIEQYENYYIKQIIKNDEDVTKKFVNSNLGNIKLINGQKYLTDLFISLYDELTGLGVYTVTIATDNDLGQEFTYSFNINTAKPPINISVEEGTETTDEILVTFNAYNIYKEVGECIIRISGKQDIILNDEYFNSQENEDITTINLTQPREYFIQILTPSERLLFTYKVTRNQPLNAIAIIVIIVGALALVGGIVVFIVLRKRMKIR